MFADVALFLVGATVVALALYDMASTTISLSSVQGPLSSRLSELVWKVGRRASGTRLTAVRRGTGPILIVTVAVGWLMTLTLGWSLIFTVDGALQASGASAEQQSADVRWIDSVFFVFGSLIGRGSSGLAPDQVAWSSIVALMSLTGVGLITLALAWILPVVSAVVQKRALAARLSALGSDPEELVGRMWNGRDLGNLDLHLLPLVDELSLLAQRHLAFPVIHYFHSADERSTISLRIAALDEALTLIEAGRLDRGAEGQLDRSTTEPLRRAISDYLATLEHIFITAGDEPPPPPDGRMLVDEDIVDVDIDELEDEIRRICDQLDSRRALLAGYVRHDGWQWSDVSRDRGGQRDDPQEQPDRT